MSDIAYKVLFDCEGNCLGMERGDGTPMKPEATYPVNQVPEELTSNVNIDWNATVQLMKITHRTAVPSGCCIWEIIDGQLTYFPC